MYFFEILFIFSSLAVYTMRRPANVEILELILRLTGLLYVNNDYTRYNNQLSSTNLKKYAFIK